MPDPLHGHHPARRWGQNFLVNEGAIDTIVRAFRPRPDDRVLEIGPGRGALTRRIVGRVARLLVVEIDPLLVTELRRDVGAAAAPGTFEVVEADILRMPADALLGSLGAGPDRPGRVIGNLPYNIATAVILRLLPLRPALVDLMLMVQREVADRIASPPGPKAYGSLSVLCQTFARVDTVLRLGPGSFRPRPKVDSTVLRLVLADPGGAAGRDPAGFADLVRAAFASRRKTILNNLSAPGSPVRRGTADTADLLRAAGIDPRRRAEQVPLAGFTALFEVVSAARGL